MTSRPIGFWVCALLLLASCQSFGPPAPELQALIQSQAWEGRRTRGTARITSDWFQGEFQVIKVERAGALPIVRLQLFPDLGGKLLDLVARPDAVLAHWPHGGEVVREREALIGFLAVSLMENATALSWDRVRGSRTTARGFLLDIQPASSGLDLHVHVQIDRAGKPLARHYQLDGVGWTEELHPAHRIHSRHFDWSFLEESAERVPRPADTLFELKLPGDDGQ